MENWSTILSTFLLQSQKGDLKTSSYPRRWSDLKLRISFGMGVPARIPWVAFTAPEMQVSHGFYPVYLFYKELNVLILAYGISETKEFSETWPTEIMNNSSTISSFLDRDVPRYGNSFVFKAYKTNISNGKVEYKYFDSEKLATDKDLESDLITILNYYKKLVSIEIKKEDSTISQGLFYMEKQLEDFIIHNWDNTELGKRYNLIIEDGELLSQQYPTNIGYIDILVRDKKSNSFVVIELKKNQTSDDTVGQVTRYMGWISDNKGDKNVKRIIIAAEYDKKLEYALKVIPNIEVFLYNVDFKLSEFKGI